ncbi:PspA/IM30 family protein [Neisseria subflava NJ9703]|jgi:pspA/IM30 family protein|uniref:PspA/IM30 family protein n=2 Tax=Neisseriaceae TaxID=481 RepID=A0A9W5N0F8_NEISU|nr:PspA/IM30 family protein [Neisseria subflava NJ9703]
MKQTHFSERKIQMSETLSRRVGRLVSGGFHALIDAAENLAPEAVMNESIREIERAVDEVRAELGKVLAQKHLAAKKMADESNRHEAIDANLQAAVDAGRDDLAEAGIAEQMDIEARLPILENTIADCAAQEKELEGFIAALQAKKREMQQQLQDWRAAQQSMSTGKTAGGNGSDLNRIARDAEKSGNAFDRVMGRQNSVHSSTDAAQLAKLKELEDLSRNNRIAERLAALKAKS